MELMQAVEHYATSMRLAELYGNDHGDADAADNAWHECQKAADRLAAATAGLNVVAELLAVVDNMGERRHELMEEAVKEMDRRLSLVRSQCHAAESLEEKLRIMKEQRELEAIRKQRRDRMFELLADGAIHAHAPLTRCELEALVMPLRALVIGTPNQPRRTK